MPRYKLTLEYDGTRFYGWQRQRNASPTVQVTIEDALQVITGTPTLIEGAGRTDTGVHATGQVAHCHLQKDFLPYRLKDALNHFLEPQGIAVLTVDIVSESFHARFNATRRHYTYRIFNRRAATPLNAYRAWHVIQPLNVISMQKAAQQLIGYHDFSSFRDSQCQAPSPLRTLDFFQIIGEGEQITATLHARSFLHHQVRIMMGTLAYIGLGKWSVDKIHTVLEACDRRAAGVTAPPHGLYLTQVDYD